MVLKRAGGWCEPAGNATESAFEVDGPNIRPVEPLKSHEAAAFARCKTRWYHVINDPVLGL